MNGNPFSNSGTMNTPQMNTQPMSTQMTFTAASNAVRNRLKQMEMRNDTNVNAFGGGQNRSNNNMNDDPFAATNNMAADPFFAQNGNANVAVNKQQNTNNDPFAVWGL